MNVLKTFSVTSSQLVALASVGTPGGHLGTGPTADAKRAVLGGAETLHPSAAGEAGQPHSLVPRTRPCFRHVVRTQYTQHVTTNPAPPRGVGASSTDLPGGPVRGQWQGSRSGPTAARHKCQPACWARFEKFCAGCSCSSVRITCVCLSTW